MCAFYPLLGLTVFDVCADWDNLGWTELPYPPLLFIQKLHLTVVTLIMAELQIQIQLLLIKSTISNSFDWQVFVLSLLPSHTFLNTLEFYRHLPMLPHLCPFKCQEGDLFEPRRNSLHLALATLSLSIYLNTKAQES